jgi:hypothetical protein
VPATRRSRAGVWRLAHPHSPKRRHEVLRRWRCAGGDADSAHVAERRRKPPAQAEPRSSTAAAALYDARSAREDASEVFRSAAAALLWWIKFCLVFCTAAAVVNEVFCRLSRKLHHPPSPSKGLETVRRRVYSGVATAARCKHTRSLSQPVSLLARRLRCGAVHCGHARSL